MLGSNKKTQTKNKKVYEAGTTVSKPLDNSEQQAPSWLSLLADSQELLISQELNTLYYVIIVQLNRLIIQANSSIIVRENDELRTIHNVDGILQEHRFVIPSTLREITPISTLISRREPIIVNDLGSEENILSFIQSIPNQFIANEFKKSRSWLAVPIIINQQVMGLLNLLHPSQDYFTSRHARLAMTVVTNATQALGRLSQQTQKLAVQEERQRIARELHDSVTQVFYGIELNINVARTLLKRNEIAQTEQQLTEVLKLAEAGLTEMRALLFELRPEALENEGLVIALKKIIDTLRLRHNLEVRTKLNLEPPISLSAKEAFYRIGQEALQNVVRHARANLVKVELNQLGTDLELVIEDNGRGFDPNISYPGHLGLLSMRERITKISGKLEIKSELGIGTKVRVKIPL